MNGRLRLGVDIGGTFTDFALFDESTRMLATHKQLTTPSDPSDCVLEGIDRLLTREGRTVSELRAVIHGTTLITNAVIERKGARTGMLVTEGFRDILDVGMESRYDLFDLRIEFSDPVVPRGLRVGIPERMRHDGEPELALDEHAVREAVRRLVEDDQIESLAICFLHAYVNPAHEQQALSLVRELYPTLPVCSSADIAPVMREFERWSTTTVNAYTQPLAVSYLGRIEQELASRGFEGAFLIMTSSGGALTSAQAQRWPVRLIESGPAAGALMAASVGEQAGYPDILSFDMGGTTAKGAVVRDAKPMKRYRLEVARAHEFRAGSGVPLRIPVIDMIEIGAGGGSLAAVDERGLLAVGPRSAGAAPGPACYGQGGEQATLTDANTLLGYLVPTRFLGGEMPLDVGKASTAIESHVAAPLGVDAARAAWGIHEVINEDVARAFRMHGSETGFDYRNCTMVAFGGSGPVHAVRVARNLGIPRVIFPPAAGVMSAVGLLVAPLAVELMRSERTRLDALSDPGIESRFAPLIEQATGFLEAAGVARGDVVIERRMDMRYAGQGYEVEVTLPPLGDEGSTVALLPARFRARYAEVFSDVTLDQPLEIVNWKVEATAPQPEVGAEFGLGFHRPGEAIIGTHPVYQPESGTVLDCPIIDRYTLGPGAVVEGPALLQERESTCVIGEGETLRIDDALNAVAELRAR